MCPWCGSSSVTFSDGPSTALSEDSHPVVPRRAPRKRVQVVDATWSDVAPRRPLNRRRLEAVALLVALIVVLAFLAIQSGALRLGTPAPSTVPKVQTLANVGDTWQINTSVPRVVDFSTAGPAVLWMNASIDNAISVFLCPSNVTIQPMGWPGGCTTALGGATHLNGSWPDIGAAGSWELAFINYGPQQGYLSTVAITWLSPLEVVAS